MECPTIINFRLTEGDIDTLNAIQKIQRNSAMLAIVLPTGVMTSIFVKSNTVGAAYNIMTTDWHGFAIAMTRLSFLERKQIEKAAKIRAVTPHLKPEQRQFWKAVGRGCEVPSK